MISYWVWVQGSATEAQLTLKGLKEVKKLVHIDIDPAEIGKNTQPLIPVVGDIKDVLTQLYRLWATLKQRRHGTEK